MTGRGIVAFLALASATVMAPLATAQLGDRKPPPHFYPLQGDVWILFGGPGSGTVTINYFIGPGIGTIATNSVSCTSDCTKQLTVGKKITLTAAPMPGSVFAGWAGPYCRGTATTCEVSSPRNFNW